MKKQRFLKLVKLGWSPTPLFLNFVKLLKSCGLINWSSFVGTLLQSNYPSVVGTLFCNKLNSEIFNENLRLCTMAFWANK